MPSRLALAAAIRPVQSVAQRQPRSGSNIHDHVLAIDQGTTSSRAIIFDADRKVVAIAQEEFPQHFPDSGWVEHDPSDLCVDDRRHCRAAIEKAGIGAGDIAAIGITNQRETTLVWDRETGERVYNAIVWQDRRTAAFCQKLKAEGHEALITAQHGLLLDPYFSSTKLAWILDNVEGARARAEAGETDLRHRRQLPHLAPHRRQAPCHRRHQRRADDALQHPIRAVGTDDICKLLRVPRSMLPEVLDCAAEFGTSRADLFGREIPILGVAGRSAGRRPWVRPASTKGMLKST